MLLNLREATEGLKSRGDWLGEMMEMFKKALEMQKAGFKAPKAELPKEAQKQFPDRSFVAKPGVVDHKSLAAGDDWDGVEVGGDEPELLE